MGSSVHNERFEQRFEQSLRQELVLFFIHLLRDASFFPDKGQKIISVPVHIRRIMQRRRASLDIDDLNIVLQPGK